MLEEIFGFLVIMFVFFMIIILFILGYQDYRLTEAEIAYKNRSTHNLNIEMSR